MKTLKNTPATSLFSTNTFLSKKEEEKVKEKLYARIMGVTIGFCFLTMIVIFF